MVITIQGERQIKCQLSDFSLYVDSAREGSGDVSIKTATELPIKNAPGSIIQGPGEYEMAGVKIRGISLPKESTAKFLRTAYIAHMDEINLCFLGELKSKPDDSVLDKLGEVDILFVGAGANATEAKKIEEIIKTIEPKLIVSLGNPKYLADELGLKPEKSDKLTIKKKDLSEATLKIIWLT
ncbi:MAG: MBL fold metallo-hydrolase [Candidatus Colwellbacteria bacterium]|nr:MBL fold metallo-hydrolase [Candidatus Colwellbacteria bacterium]